MAMATATNYVVTVQRPTAVSAVATGYFTAPNEHNLIVAKNTHFEIYLIGSEGLKLSKMSASTDGSTSSNAFDYL